MENLRLNLKTLERKFLMLNRLTEIKDSFIFLKLSKINQIIIAEVAELVDALGSGSSTCMGVGVRVPSSAPCVRSG
jgi:hypothetical protein